MARAPARQTISLGSFLGGGGRIPPIIFVLMAATAVLSIVGTVGMRHGFPLPAWGALVPELVLHGQAWRLFTWVLFEIDHPFSLIFACLALIWFGRDLALRWGTIRFVLFYFGLATVIGALVTALSLAYSPLRGYAYLGTWPLQEATIILWASFYPSRQLLMYFVLPLGGRMLVLLTIAMTVLFSLFYGIEQFIPHFIAEALALGMAAIPGDLWTEHKLRVMEQKRRASHLRSVPRDPTPPEGEGPPNGRWLN